MTDAAPTCKLPRSLSLGLIVGTFAALTLLEWRQPLRQQNQPKLRRIARNLAVAAASGAAVAVTSAPLTGPLTRLSHRRRIGLTKLLHLPVWLETMAGLLLLDYTLYLWHRAFHAFPMLWRFHQVHHVDHDMDTSTGLRFHFGEMILTAVLQAFQILAIGISPLTFSIWNTWLLCEVMFHHSNLRLPRGVEWWVSKLIVTPRMHGVHHSDVPAELNSNWSSGLSLWDFLHGTLKRNVPQREITIGVAAYPDPAETTVGKLLTMPFAAYRDPTQRPDGSTPRRDTNSITLPDRLASLTRFLALLTRFFSQARASPGSSGRR